MKIYNGVSPHVQEALERRRADLDPAEVEALVAALQEAEENSMTVRQLLQSMFRNLGHTDAEAIQMTEQVLADRP